MSVEEFAEEPDGDSRCQTRSLDYRSGSDESQAATPPCREHVPVWWRLKLYEPSRHRALAPCGTAPEIDRDGLCTDSPSWFRYRRCVCRSLSFGSRNSRAETPVSRTRSAIAAATAGLTPLRKARSNSPSTAELSWKQTQQFAGCKSG